MSYIATRFEMFLARLLGKKIVRTEGDVTVTSYFYRGRLYIYKIDYQS